MSNVPITFYVSGQDEICPIDDNYVLYTDATSSKVWYVEENADHGTYGYIDGDQFLAKMVAAIETGDPADYQDHMTTEHTYE